MSSARDQPEHPEPRAHQSGWPDSSASAIRGAARQDASGEDGGNDSARVRGAPVVWHKGNQEERCELWAEFTAWVIRMADTYELTSEQLPHACWWEHGAVVAELTALWTGLGVGMQQ
ncbi:hypothetical protein [Streptomyces nigra]|uniref:hypothetical protein n=1 Tax=Streptomyces nigra TaxID=1827580 RepID=UPI0037153B84